MTNELECITEFLRDWFVSTFYKCKKCNGKLDLKREGATKMNNSYPIIGGWYHINCAIIRDESCLEFDEKLRKMSEMFEND